MNRLFLIGFAVWAVVGASFYGTKLLNPQPPKVVRGPMPTKKKVASKAARRFRAPEVKKTQPSSSPSEGKIYSNLQKKIAKINEYNKQKLGMPESYPTTLAAPPPPPPSAQETKPFANRRNDAYNPRAHRYEGAPSVHSARSGEELQSARSQYLAAQERAWDKDEVLTAFNQIYQYVMERGGAYQSAFASLTRDVQISSTPEPLKGELLQLIRQEEKGYREYFQGTR